MRGYASLSLADDKDDGGDLELSVIENGADVEALDKTGGLILFPFSTIFVFAILSIYFIDAVSYCNATSRAFYLAKI